MLKRLTSTAALLLLTGISAIAAPTVSESTISWPDDGWYQVQVINDNGYVEVCQGGRSCTVPAGEYVVINHSTGERFNDISIAGVSVIERVISLPDNGWYQVLDENTYSEVCAGTRTCEVQPGSYLVINHSTGERFAGLVVEQVARPTLPINDSANTISHGWDPNDQPISGEVPLAEAGPDRAHALGDSVTLHGGNSSDKDGTLTSYQWRKNGLLLGQEASLSIHWRLRMKLKIQSY